MADGAAPFIARARAAWQGPPARRVRLLPQQLLASELAKVATTAPGSLLLGIDESRLAPVALNSARDAHLIVLGDRECGKTNLLRYIVRQITAHNLDDPSLSVERAPRQSRIILVDFNRTLLDVADGPMIFKYVTSAAELTDLVKELRGVLAQRIPGREVTAAQLREQSWWRGKAIYLMIDDYDLVAGGGQSAATQLSDLLAQGAQIGFHVVVARRAKGASRAMHDSLLGQMRNMETPTLLMSGDKDEGVLVGSLRPGPLPPGRGHLVTRDATRLVQTALTEVEAALSEP
jgi:S-DNA-T family DNA segregation ATPase FtsK/SpoIIIE